jgi:hemerythrin-like domain-containing protein
MRRSEELASLSRDHHHGLVAALKLARATEATLADARAAFLTFWHEEGQRHFAIEEAVLLPAFARRGPADHAAVVRVLVEHVDVRSRAQALEEEPHPPLASLHELGTRMQAHIRHEEQVLFTLIEETLPHDELVALGAALERAEQA